MSFDRNQVPDAIGYFEGQGLRLTGKGKWRTTSCNFHEGSDSMRVNTASGAWVCMSCGAKGGDALAYDMQAHGREFVETAKALGAWIDDGKPATRHKPVPLPPWAALEVLAFESTLTAIAACNIAKGVVLSAADRQRLLVAANRVNRIAEATSELQRF